MVYTFFCSCQASEACRNEQIATSLADSGDEAASEWYSIYFIDWHWLDFSLMLYEWNKTTLIDQFTVGTHSQ